MNEKKQVERREEQAAVDAQTIYVPNVDIIEDGQSLRLLADMPGVDQGSVEVSIENDVLTIEGQTQTEAPAGYQLVGQEHGLGRYRRAFTLSDAVDASRIKARVRQGVLELTLPKQERVQTRKIKIES